MSIAVIIMQSFEHLMSFLFKSTVSNLSNYKFTSVRLIAVNKLLLCNTNIQVINLVISISFLDTIFEFVCVF